MSWDPVYKRETNRAAGFTYGATAKALHTRRAKDRGQSFAATPSGRGIVALAGGRIAGKLLIPRTPCYLTRENSGKRRVKIVEFRVDFAKHGGAERPREKAAKRKEKIGRERIVSFRFYKFRC